VNKSYEVEYSNLELRFDRRHIQELIKELIQDGYSLYWSENESQLIVSVRTGRKLLKFRFQKIVDKYKLVGDYSFRDEKLAGLMERLIGDTRGHAVVKRFKDRQILIENIMFGKTIRMVEISGVDRKVIFQKNAHITIEEIIRAFKSNRAELRIPIVRLELDYELAMLYEHMKNGDAAGAEACKARLEELRREMLLLEM
jgi:hypothetical protein